MEILAVTIAVQLKWNHIPLCVLRQNHLRLATVDGGCLVIDLIVLCLDVRIRRAKMLLVQN